MKYLFNIILFVATIFPIVAHCQREVPDIFVQQFANKLQNDMLKLGHAALRAANGGNLSPQIENQVTVSGDRCKSQAGSLDKNEFKMSFDNFSNRKAIQDIPTPGISAFINNCALELEKDVKAIDANIIVPDRDFKKMYTDPKVIEELKKIDPNNTFIAAAAKEKSTIPVSSNLPTSLHITPPVAEVVPPSTNTMTEPAKEVLTTIKKSSPTTEPITKPASNETNKESNHDLVKYAFIAVVLLFIFLKK